MTEHEHQSVVCDWMDARGIKYFAVPNGFVGGGRNRFAGINKLKREGMRNGAPDLVLITLTEDARPVAVEMKTTEKSSVQSQDQIDIEEEMVCNGWVYILGRGADDAISKIESVLGVK